MVTLDGAVVHKSGLMTGGQHIQKTNASLTWTRQDLARLTEMKDALSGQLERVHAAKTSAIEINSLTEEVAGLDESIQQCRGRITSLERDVSERIAEHEYYQTQNGNLESLLGAKSVSLAEVEGQIRDTRTQIRTVQETVYGDFCARYSLLSIDEYEFASGPGMRARARERAKLVREMSSLKNQVNLHAENAKQTQTRIDRLQADAKLLTYPS